jgi:hypothetical protein
MFAFKMAGDVEDGPSSQELAQAFSGSSLGRRRDCQYSGIRGFLGCGRMVVVAVLLAFAIAHMVSTCAAGAQYCRTWRG